MKRPFRFSTDDVKVETKTPLFKGFFKMVRYQFQHRLFEGGWTPILSREVFERGHAVAVLLYDPREEAFVMIEQFRIGAMATSDCPWLLEVVAGIIEPGEDAREVCYRETVEETGLTLQHLTPALTYLSSPGGTTERLHVFVGCVDASQAGGVHGLDHEGEDILVHVIPEPEIRDWLDGGKIDNAATLIAVQWFLLNKQKVLDDWGQ
ncbi:ADP-ribose diphosphatase [Aestuariibacter halophilus]|uniref:ADP-ribose pyrophosphatase n=1 Tax=Fluctibacter halophilus TaxID=226011 RepID=A0ABS8GBG9_9ALTE|nr:ADP-ribose diphosphatase [Aestuariibacter halophilus]MCC2617935.1 ADP-ribose diphosphatase [Aestuariibacter halophilus]